MAMIDLTASPNNSWTTRQLRAWIRRATQDLNRQFYEISVNGVDLKKDSPLLYEQRNRLIELGTGREFRGGVGLGLTYKTKSELVVQARALRETYNIMERPQRETAAESNAYKTFNANRPGLNMSYKEYKELTEILGAIGAHVFNEFGYESFIEAYDEARNQGKSGKNVLDAVVEVQREQRNGDSLQTTEDMVDALRGKLIE